MPIVRTYYCPECAHRLEVTLRADQWDTPPPNCPSCNAWDFDEPMAQEFKPPAIGGSVAGRAARITEDIIANDYHVSNYTPDNREGGVPKVTYRDQTGMGGSQWAGDMLQQGIEIGRATRRQYGSGLDILQSNLKSGAEPDLIEASKRRAIKVY